MTITFHLNGRLVKKDLIPNRRCIEVLREDFQCRSPHYRCKSASCGSCLILVDGNPVFSCIMPAFELQGREVWTMEGLSTQEGFGDILGGFQEANAPLCTYCAPSRALAAEALLRQTLRPTKEQLVEAAASVTCECTSSSRVIRAMSHSAQKRRSRLHDS